MDPDQVVHRYLELRSLAQTSREFGISREWVRQLVNQAGFSTARRQTPKPAGAVHTCPECGTPVTKRGARYCATHRSPAAKSRRTYLAIKSDPERYSRLLEQIRQSKKRCRERQQQTAAE